MNRAHRLADQVRSVVSWLHRPSSNAAESQFTTKGFLTPAEFVDAGDQLVYLCPTWEWQGSKLPKREVAWLPPQKQYLLTRNIPCLHRVSDWDVSFYRKAMETPEGWVMPGPPPAASRGGEGAEAVAAPVAETTARALGGVEVAVRHEREADEVDDADEESEIAAAEVCVAAAGSPQGRRYSGAHCPGAAGAQAEEGEGAGGGRPPVGEGGERQGQGEEENRVDHHVADAAGSSSRSPSGSRSCSEMEFVQLLEEENEAERDVAGGGNEIAGGFCLLSAAHRRPRSTGPTIPTRTYDLSITYDKYYQCPRVWLFGYDEAGIPLAAEAVFEDIHSTYLSKTVTVDPHPFTGIPTVSIHPCKHAAVMKSVAQSWIEAGSEPRPDLALFVLLKMVASVAPTINYDFTIDVPMPGGATATTAKDSSANESSRLTDSTG